MSTVFGVCFSVHKETCRGSVTFHKNACVLVYQTARRHNFIVIAVRYIWVHLSFVLTWRRHGRSCLWGSVYISYSTPRNKMLWDLLRLHAVKLRAGSPFVPHSSTATPSAHACAGFGSGHAIQLYSWRRLEGADGGLDLPGYTEVPCGLPVLPCWPSVRQRRPYSKSLYRHTPELRHLRFQTVAVTRKCPQVESLLFLMLNNVIMRGCKWMKL
jgi:hypothetical protein